ncbi:MAG: hypothetical protein PUC12_06415 [Clostridiales bacterium]|nr:hypothetical protein [Clostridiales bacterium]
MKVSKENPKEVLFDSYAEGNTELISELDDRLEAVFLKLVEEFESGHVDYDTLADMKLNAMHAGFYAGFAAAKSLLIG